MTEDRRYLVTGGAGFIGSHLVENLLRRGAHVTVIDNFTTGRRENLDSAVKDAGGSASNLKIVEGDIRDAVLIERVMKDGITHVLHQAALPSVQRSIEDPETSHAVNATATLALLEQARRCGVRRFVYAASSSAYGDTPTLPKLESMTPIPLSPYAASKLAGEHYCRIYHQLFGLETVALRYFNIFGPRQDPASDYAAVVPKFVQAALAGKAPRVFGDGHQSRDFTYIDNAVDANLRACEAPMGAVGKVYNVACGASATLLELIRMLGSILGRSITPVHEAPRAGDVKDSLASIDEARQALGYEPRVDLEEGLRRTIAWFGT